MIIETLISEIRKIFLFTSTLLVIIGILYMSSLGIDSKLNIKLVKTLATKVYSENKVLADLTVAQAILESNLLGNKPSKLALKYNNLFGIKGRGTKGSVALETTEYVKGKPLKVKQNFAWNNSVEDSIEQRKKLFQNGTVDKPTRYFKVLSAQTFEDAAKALYEAGYATDIHYTQQLINIYNKYIKGN